MSNLFFNEIPLLGCRVTSCIQKNFGLKSSMIKDSKLGGGGWWGSPNTRDPNSEVKISIDQCMDRC